MKKIDKNIAATTAILEASYSKREDYLMLVKHKLSFTVVFTSLLGYLIMSGLDFKILDLILLTVGGFLVTGAANAINQVLEKEYDAQMKRTAIRPLASNRMSVSEAVMFAGVSCLIGVAMLSIFNPITGVLGMISFLLYSFIYTPLKRFGPVSVAIGAIPGALPLLIGCTAYEGRISVLAICLFAIQFLWQFPHFWSIGYLGFADYKKAGFKLVPELNGEVDPKIGQYSLMYTVLLFPVIGFMAYFGYISILAFVLCGLVTGGFTYFAIEFMRNLDIQSARKLMFSSFMYMPFILLICLFL